MKNPRVEILMATYNGSRYVINQIESFTRQTYANWRLIIGDDGSTDDTVKILTSYQKLHRGKIKIIKNRTNLGIVKNFNNLLANSSAEYVMFSDQDDIWLPEKIDITLQRMLSVEKINPGKPVLVHTDLTVVDDNLQVLGQSFCKYQKLNPRIKSLNRLMVQNNVTGCTVMINKQMKTLCLPIPDKVIMHDWYLSLLASYKGVIDFIPASTILYRQHHENRIGASRYDHRYVLRKVSAIFNSINTENLRRCMEQASVLEESDTARLFSQLHSYSWIMRRYYMLKFGFLKYGILKNIGLFLVI